MTSYDSLVIEANAKGLDVFELNFPPRLKGTYADNVIGININLPTKVEKACALVEEVGHHETTTGDILDQKKALNRKQEKRARTWGYIRMLPLSGFVSAHAAGIKNRYEFAQFFGVTEEFVDHSLVRYQEMYGLFTEYDGHMILFEPLMVIEPFS
jgi:hypothetical protein